MVGNFSSDVFHGILVLGEVVHWVKSPIPLGDQSLSPTTSLPWSVVSSELWTRDLQPLFQQINYHVYWVYKSCPNERIINVINVVQLLGLETKFYNEVYNSLTLNLRTRLPWTSDLRSRSQNRDGEEWHKLKAVQYLRETWSQRRRHFTPTIITGTKGVAWRPLPSLHTLALL